MDFTGGLDDVLRRYSTRRRDVALLVEPRPDWEEGCAVNVLGDGGEVLHSLNCGFTKTEIRCMATAHGILTAFSGAIGVCLNGRFKRGDSILYAVEQDGKMTAEKFAVARVAAVTDGGAALVIESAKSGQKRPEGSCGYTADLLEPSVKLLGANTFVRLNYTGVRIGKEINSLETARQAFLGALIQYRGCYRGGNYDTIFGFSSDGYSKHEIDGKAPIVAHFIEQGFLEEWAKRVGCSGRADFLREYTCEMLPHLSLVKDAARANALGATYRPYKSDPLERVVIFGDFLELLSQVMGDGSERRYVCVEFDNGDSEVYLASETPSLEEANEFLFANGFFEDSEWESAISICEIPYEMAADLFELENPDNPVLAIN